MFLARDVHMPATQKRKRVIARREFLSTSFFAHAGVAPFPLLFFSILTHLFATSEIAGSIFTSTENCTANKSIRNHGFGDNVLRIQAEGQEG